MTLAVLMGLFLSISTAQARGVNDAFAEIMSRSNQEDFNEFEDLDLAALMNINVTSVAGVEQSWFTTPAAMHVITNDDVRRTGHRTIAEALRLAPGLHVARVGSSIWSVGSRGFGGRFSGHLLVLIDGRSVYTPLHSGTFWDAQDILMEDLDRIEVIRGPGATLWGANAVNGVINVTTRSAKETQGWYFSSGGGTHERGFTAARYGGKINDNIHYRVYGKYDNRSEFVDAGGNALFDDWDKAQGGMRFDIEGDNGYTLTVQGDYYYSGRSGVQYWIPEVGMFPMSTMHFNDDRYAGGNVLFRLKKQNDDHSEWTVQGYYDRTSRDVLDTHEVRRDTFDLDFRHLLHVGDRHEILWGLGVRRIFERKTPAAFLFHNPQDINLTTYSGFVQDTITLVDDKLFLMLGTKLEHNDVTGFEIQPSARLSWTPNENHTLWGAVSRPVRVPSRNEKTAHFIAGYMDEGLLMGGFPNFNIVPIVTRGNKDIQSEEMLGFEMGYRVKLSEFMTLDTAVYYNEYRKMIVIPDFEFMFQNAANAETYGGEVALHWRVTPNWRLQGSYSFHRTQMHGPIYPFQENTTPQHQFQIQSYLNITHNLEFNSALYMTGGVESTLANENMRLDMGLTWRPTDNIELTIWGQNLLQESHLESGDWSFLMLNEVPRGVYGQVTVRY